jgi:Cof subfamily protein (haloacid dehalogenase superfamily)
MTTRLVALDIDGTLLDPGVPVDAVPGTAMTDAVQKLLANDITVVLASGRMYPGTQRIAQHLNVRQPLICQQGASVHEPDGNLRHSFNVDPRIALELFDYAKQNGWPLAWFDASRYLVTRHCEQAQFFADVSGIDIVIDENPHRSDIRPTGIDIISTRKAASRVHGEIEKRYGERLSILDFPSVTAVHAPAASKGNALRVLTAELGIASSEVLAIGDSVNDVSMLEWAGMSAAPSHCDHYARNAAKQVLTEPGVAGVISRLHEALQT